MKCLLILTFVITGWIAGCAALPTPSSQPASDPSSTPPSTEQGQLKCPAKTWCPAYDQFVLARLPQAPAGFTLNLAGLCKTNPPPQKFWPAIVKAIMKSESGFDPSTVYQEKFPDKMTGKPALSVGLMQLSVGDKLNYRTPTCLKLTPETLKDAAINLGCALEIMGERLRRDRGESLQDSLGKYWSTIRPGHPATAGLLQILPECR